MDEEKRNAILRATKRLIQSNAPKEQVLSSLRELGFSAEESEKIYDDSEKLEASGPASKQSEKAGASKMEFWETLVDEQKPMKPKQEIELPKKQKTFIPKLNTGGKEKVKEIIVKSPLESNAAEKIAMQKTSDAQSKKEAKSTMSPSQKNLTGFGFQSTLDDLEKKLEKGEKIEQALKEIPESKTEKIRERFSDISILIIPNREYNQGISALMVKTNATYKKIVYVNLNELYNSLINHMRNLNVDVKKFFFVDAITITSDKETRKHDNCIFVTSPNALIELSLAITQALNMQKPDAILFDSLSTLLIYENDNTVTKFIHSLIGKIKAAGIDAYFTALEGDSHSEAIKDLSMFVDRVNTLTEFELGEMGFRHENLELRMNPINIGNNMALPPLHAGSKHPAPENAVVAREMQELRQRLDEMQSSKQLMKNVADLSGKVGKSQELKALREQVEKISEKIDDSKEKPVDKTLVNQISRLEQKISEMSKQKQVSRKSNNDREILDSIKKLREKVEGIEKLSGLKEEVNSLSKKVDSKKPVDNQLILQISKIASKMDSLEKQISDLKQKKNESEKTNLKKKIVSYKKQLEMESMMNEMYKEAPVSGKEKNKEEIVKKIDKKKSTLKQAFKKGFITKESFEKGNNRLTNEKKRFDNSALVASLEAKLDALTEAYDSGVISKEAFLAGKARIEKRLKQ